MFLADENVDREIVDRLRRDGHDVVWIAQFAPGITDDEVLRLASANQRVLVTADKDFGELVFRQGKANAGVILLRVAGATASKKADIVARAVRMHSAAMRRSFSVISIRQVRIRRGVE